MINEKLHLLFHDLLGAISGIDTLSQICVAYITKFNLEKLEGKFKKEITGTFRNLLSYRKTINEKLGLVVPAIIGIGEKDIAQALRRNVIRELEKIKGLEADAGLLHRRILKTNTKDNLYRFSRKLSEFKAVCDSLIKIISDSKEKLAALGKY